MVPVDGVEKQTPMLSRPAEFVFLRFAAVKKPQQNHTLAQSRHGCSFSHRPIRQPKRVGGARVADESKAVGASVGCRRLCSFRMRDPRWLADSALLYLSRQRLSRTPPSHLP